MIVLSPDALADVERLRTFLDQANPGAARREHDVAILSVALSGRSQPLDFRLKLKAQLCAFFIGQPVRHLRKNGAVKQNRPWLPR
jgi:plasmid stabilization system protein ParE